MASMGLMILNTFSCCLIAEKKKTRGDTELDTTPNTLVVSPPRRQSSMQVSLPRASCDTLTYELDLVDQDLFSIGSLSTCSSSSSGFSSPTDSVSHGEGGFDPDALIQRLEELLEGEQDVEQEPEHEIQRSESVPRLRGLASAGSMRRKSL
ncbi:hypothetical protein OQA88_8349 [Cercophora sp. LCS_1]